ncbi:hypothetical protein E1B28_005669 [Marasmius oreades]|uniref:Gamma-butyrobetaine hydroxylase n=1 Tax=Marasmius oreades TaxID=181124 RepID=A0A9P7UVU8_9AGAR|nr:uncharacterized protein E1B28_005669 [Marasmius oreades]KAG7094861.1 hypothetical protein E1B28_005669 [Marasmius oreades]
MTLTIRLSSYLSRAASTGFKRPLPRTRTWSSFTMGDQDLTIDTLHTSFPYAWLRDSCQGKECVHPATTQKLHQTSDISPDVKPIIVSLEGEKGINIEWEDGHKSFFEREFLERHSSPKGLNEFHKDISQKFWDKDQISQSKDLFIPYEELKAPAGLLKAMNQLRQYGLLFVRAVPNEVTDHQNCELRQLASLFSDIRPTFYGEVWDVQNKNSENIAYTNLNLGFHMDLLYFSNPPRYQILHCIRNKVEGGTSLFADAFNAAYQLRKINTQFFDVLSKTPVSFQYVFGERHYHQLHPTIQLSPTNSSHVEYINYSPPFQGPLLLSTPIMFYHALQRYDQALQDSQNVYHYTLCEGDAVLFDNRRVLHARTAFKDPVVQQRETVNRWLMGCYFEGDEMWDRARALGRRLDEKPSIVP